MLEINFVPPLRLPRKIPCELYQFRMSPNQNKTVKKRTTKLKKDCNHFYLFPSKFETLIYWTVYSVIKRLCVMLSPTIQILCDLHKCSELQQTYFEKRITQELQYSSLFSLFQTWVLCQFIMLVPDVQINCPVLFVAELYMHQLQLLGF